MSATLLFVLAIIVIGLWYIAQRTRQQTGLPWATTLASDVNDALPNQETLITCSTAAKALSLSKSTQPGAPNNRTNPT